MPTKVKQEELPLEVRAAMKALDKKFGKNSVLLMSDSPDCTDVKNLIPTGSLKLDKAIGTLRKNAKGEFEHGLPSGRVVEIYGPEASGKTSLCNQIIAQSQRQGGLCAFIDMEQSWHKEYAESLGVKTDDLIVSQPDCGEEALEIANTLLKTGKFSVIVVDSVAALVPRKELEGDVGDSAMGVQARMMSQSLRMMGSTIRKTATTVIFTNQLRSKIGVFFGSPEVTTGGNALKFYASIRMDCRKIAVINNQDGEPIGHTLKIKLVKNKLAAPFRIAEFNLFYGKGTDKIGEIIDMCIQYKMIEKSGSWYTFGEEKVQGTQGLREAIVERGLVKDLYAEVMERMYAEAS